MSPEKYHITAISCKADFEVLNDSTTVRACVDKLIAAGNYTKLGEISHSFSSQGVTVVALLSESHIAVHTWPEHGAAKIVIATCRKDVPNDVFERVIRDTLGATNIHTQEVADV